MRSKTKRSNKRIKFLGLKKIELMELGLGLVVIIGIFVGLILIRKPVHPNISAVEETVDVYFNPSNMGIPSSTPSTLMMNARTNQVSFSRVQINFDPTKVLLASEVSLSSPLKKVIKVSTMAEANSTGKLIIALGLAPADKANPPTGVFVIGNLRFSPVNTTTTSTSFVSLDATKTQVVSTRATNLPLNLLNLSLTSNMATPQPSPTPIALSTSTQMSCKQLVSGSMSTTTLAVGQTVTVSCDFGKQGIDCIRPYYLDKTATAYIYPCTQTGWSGSKALFSCIAPKTPGTYSNVCGLIAGTASNCKQGLCTINKTKFTVK